MQTKNQPKHTKRYYQTENRIIRASYYMASQRRSAAGMTIYGICQRAKIHASTFYRHFRNLLDFSRQNDDNYLQSFSELVKELSSTNLSTQQTYERVLIFIYHHRLVVRLKLSVHNNCLLEETFRMMRPLIMRHWNNYGADTNDYIYSIFSASAIQVINIWYQRHHFNSKMIPSFSRQLSRLDRVACPTLAPVSRIC